MFFLAHPSCQVQGEEEKLSQDGSYSNVLLCAISSYFLQFASYLQNRPNQEGVCKVSCIWLFRTDVYAGHKFQFDHVGLSMKNHTWDFEICICAQFPIQQVVIFFICMMAMEGDDF